MADGDARLQVVLEAKIDKLIDNLNKAEQKLGAFSRAGYGAAQKVRDALDRPIGGNVGKALDSVFDSTRLRILDTGIARVGLFGSAFEHLGAIGIVTAGIIGAAGLAVGNALKTAEWADGLQETAKRLGISTTALQEFDFVAKQTDIPVETMRSSLQGLNGTIGQVITGLAKARTLAAFKDLLKIDPEDLRRLGDVEHILPVILEHAVSLSSSARAALAKALKVDPGVLNSLIEARGRMSELIEQAHRYGIIVDEDVINRSAEAAEKLKFASDVIDRNLKVAFAGLATPIADATTALAQFIAGLNGLGDFDVAPLHQKFGIILRDVLQLLQTALALDAIGGSHQGPVKPAFTPITTEQLLRGIKAPPLPTHDPVVPGAAKHGPADQTDNLTKQAEEDLQRAVRGLAEAYKALTDDVDKRAQFEVQANDAAAAAEQAKLKGDLDKLLKDKTIDGAVSDQLQAKIEEAQADVELARLARNRLVERNAAEAIEDRQIETHKAIIEAMLAELQAQADIAATAAQRTAIERRILEIRQQLERDLRGTELDRQVKHGEISPETAAREKGAIGVSQGAEQTQFGLAHRTPVQQFISDNDPAKAVENFERIGVNAFDHLADSLAEAAANGKNLGDVLLNFVRSLLQELLASSLKSTFSSIFSSLLGIPGHAAGTSLAPGGPSWLNERGPELVELPSGSKVMTAAATRAALSVRPHGGGGAVTLQINVDAGGAITQGAIETMVRRGSLEAVAQARALARGDYASAQYDNWLNR